MDPPFHHAVCLVNHAVYTWYHALQNNHGASPCINNRRIVACFVSRYFSYQCLELVWQLGLSLRPPECTQIDLLI